MQRVDVLGDQEEAAAAYFLPALELDESSVGGVGLGAVHRGEAVEVPGPLPDRIAVEGLSGGELDVRLFPDRVRLAAAEGADAAGGADAGAGDDEKKAGMRGGESLEERSREPHERLRRGGRGRRAAEDPSLAQSTESDCSSTGTTPAWQAFAMRSAQSPVQPSALAPAPLL